MKTKVSILVAAVALITLSFTFASFDKPAESAPETTYSQNSAPVGGFIADEMVK